MSLNTFSNSAQRSNGKKLVLIRHGITECNEYLSQHPWGSKHFQDPRLWDTRLSETGLIQAERVNLHLAASRPSYLKMIDIVVSSPLTRALVTSDIVLKDLIPEGVQKIALPLARERLYLSSDVGRSSSILKSEFPSWDFSLVPETDWWYYPSDPMEGDFRPEGDYACPGEPEEPFRERMILLKSWILDRPEKTIALVAHWGVLKALTGRDMENCEMYICDSDSLLSDDLLVLD